MQRTAFGLAVATAVCALPLLFSGGSVTSYGVGMAVPDWPTTFGENMVTYNMTEAPFGVKVEHGHRLIGMVVGMLGMGMFATTMIAGVACKAKKIVGLAFLAICVQGVLGGMRVELNRAGWGTQLAIGHGVLGQVTFCLLVAAATMLGAAKSPAETLEGEFGTIRKLSLLLPVLWLAQLVSGAFIRHLGQGFAVHATSAGLLFIATIAMVMPTLLDARLRRTFGLSTGMLGGLMCVQIFLGLGAMLATDLVPPQWRTWSPSHGEALLRTAHQFNSALFGALAIRLAMTLRSRLRVPPAHSLESGLSLEAVS